MLLIVLWKRTQESPGNETVGGGAEAERSDAERDQRGIDGWYASWSHVGTKRWVGSRHMGRASVKGRMGQSCAEGKHPDDRPQTLWGCLFHEPQKPYLCVFALHKPKLSPSLIAQGTDTMGVGPMILRCSQSCEGEKRVKRQWRRWQWVAKCINVQGDVETEGRVFQFWPG